MAAYNPTFTAEELQNEFWKSIANYETRYEASNLGNVRNLITKKILKTTPHKDGYRLVSLYANGKPKTFNAHKLIAVTFMGDCPRHHEVNHKDGNKANNRIGNLEYKTHGANMIHARLTGLWSVPKLDEKAVLLIIELLSIGYCPSKIARIISMSPTTIQDIKNGATWKHLTGK